ncbi:monovalent cation/H(+) antiporter subunit G [Proteobacteria bacterium 005FR1]|nr:monovalent cation/H(+) antiporter subunit G [Proteobacteria bacterium 005FR1]
MDTVVNIVSGACLLLGSFLIFSGGLGLLRFPDFYTRMHAAGITETLATGLILLGLMLLAGWGIVLAKLMMILLFILITSPTASHALAKSAQHGKLAPQLAEPEDQRSR